MIHLFPKFICRSNFFFGLASLQGQGHHIITIGPIYRTKPVNISCGKKPEYPGKANDFACICILYSSSILFKSNNQTSDLGGLKARGFIS